MLSKIQRESLTKLYLRLYIETNKLLLIITKNKIQYIIMNYT